MLQLSSNDVRHDHLIRNFHQHSFTEVARVQVDQNARVEDQRSAMSIGELEQIIRLSFLKLDLVNHAAKLHSAHLNSSASCPSDMSSRFHAACAIRLSRWRWVDRHRSWPCRGGQPSRRVPLGRGASVIPPLLSSHAQSPSSASPNSSSRRPQASREIFIAGRSG